jgi:ketosteroid isomerase-like protein
MLTRIARRQSAPWVVAGALVIALIGASCQTPSPGPPPFEQAVKEHLAAIIARDMDALVPTLTGQNALTMIAPNGARLETRQQFIDFHRQWFATNDDGKYEWEIVRLIESPALGHALIKYRYTSKDSAGAQQVMDSWLALTFAVEDGRWRLVFDQNTMIAPGSAK